MPTPAPEHHTPNLERPATSIPPPKNSQGIKCDWEQWRTYLAGVDAPDDQKREMIETLWAIVVEFVDLGMDVSAQESCGQVIDLNAALEAAVLNSYDTKEAEES